LPHLRLAERVLLRKFDKFYAYNAETDELYELDEEAFNFLKVCDGRYLEINQEFLEYLLSENLVTENDEKREIEVIEADEPSLRYLLLNITWYCNLSCKHCYVVQSDEYMEYDTFKSCVDQFYQMGGLKILISGGEPLLHPGIWNFLTYARNKPLRVVLLTNGYLIDDETAAKLRHFVDEVQISLDGLRGHEKLRGTGYKPVIKSISRLIEHGVDVSVSTMLTKYSINELDEMNDLLGRLGVKRWSLDVPTTTEDILPPLNLAAEAMKKYGFGEMGHEGTQNYACGSNFASVTPSGDVTKCGFFTESVGNIAEGLDVCWERMKKKFIWKLSELKCRCQFITTCRGGCRYRAITFLRDLHGCDPVMCHIFGVKN